MKADLHAIFSAVTLVRAILLQALSLFYEACRRCFVLHFAISLSFSDISSEYFSASITAAQ